HLGLAKIYQRQKKYAAALTETDQAVKLDPERTEAHYVRGQVLLRVGRKAGAKKEMTAAANPRKEVSVPSPELLQESQGYTCLAARTSFNSVATAVPTGGKKS